MRFKAQNTETEATAVPEEATVEVEVEIEIAEVVKFKEEPIIEATEESIDNIINIGPFFLSLVSNSNFHY